MSDSGDSQGAYWDSVTAYRTPADRIESVTKWGTPELDLHGYYLREVPGQVWTMAHLKELHLYNNRLTALPKDLGNLTGLTWLNIAGNELETLPDGIGQLRGKDDARATPVPSNSSRTYSSSPHINGGLTNSGWGGR
jgi:Leucine-rich repeat (LRR) protein